MCIYGFLRRVFIRLYMFQYVKKNEEVVYYWPRTIIRSVIEALQIIPRLCENNIQ